MVKYIAKLNRSITIKLIYNKNTYLFGMVFVRLGRYLRKLLYSESNDQAEIIELSNEIRMSVIKNTYMGGSLYWTGFHHISEIIFLNSYLKSDMVFIDIGANQGEFSLFASSKLKDGHVFSFEPVSFQREMLITNMHLNKSTNISYFDFGLGNKNIEVPIYTTYETKSHFGKHEGLSSQFHTESRNELQELINIKVFDELFYENLKRMDVIKIDIEGAELFALQGMEASLRKFKPLIMLEINDETFKSAGYSTNDIVGYLELLGYDFYKIFRGIILNTPIKNFNSWGNYIAINRNTTHSN